MIISRSVYVAANGIISFFLWPNSISLYIFIHSSVSGPLGCFYTLAIATSAAVNIGVHVSFWSVVFSNTCPAMFLACPSAPDTKRDQLGETYLDGNSETWKSP